MAATNLTVARVREVLDYDPETGALTWRISRKTTSKPAGSVAGCIDKSLGYVRIWLDGSARYGHILAWMLGHGELPPPLIDHIDGNRSNNRLSNLRSGENNVNAQNRRVQRRNATGRIGVTTIKPKTPTGPVRFRAVIRADGVTHRLGNFYSADEASEAYLAAKARLHRG